MSKRTPMDKQEVRERRNRLLDTAAAAELSLTEAVREMRAIAGMTQEEFARHRGVSARVIKAIELGQGNPTVATLNRIGEFFGLKVAFVPAKRTLPAETQPPLAAPAVLPALRSVTDLITTNPAAALEALEDVAKTQRLALAALRQQMVEAHEALDNIKHKIEHTGAIQPDGKPSTGNKGKRR